MSKILWKNLKFQSRVLYHISNNKNLKKFIYLLTKMIFCHQRRAVSYWLSGSSNDWLLFQVWERRWINQVTGEGPWQTGAHPAAPKGCKRGRHQSDSLVPLRVQVIRQLKRLSPPRALTLVMLNNRIYAQFVWIYILMYLFFPSKTSLYFSFLCGSLILGKFFNFYRKKLLLTI